MTPDPTPEPDIPVENVGTIWSPNNGGQYPLGPGVPVPSDNEPGVEIRDTHLHFAAPEWHSEHWIS